MRFLLGLLVCAAIAPAQTGAPNPEIELARTRLEKLKSLVEAGVAPRVQLAQAAEDLADAEDAAFLRRTLYGQDLTDAQSDAMIAAASRRLERRTDELDRAEKLANAGAAPVASLASLREQVELARKECDLAASRAQVVHEIAAMAEAERTFEETPAPAPVSEHHEGSGVFTMSRFAQVEKAFEHKFGKPLPVSAMGETDVHRTLGFDHRGRVDVALHPDQPEGIWLRAYLDENHIPYFAFRQAVTGKATGAHIHLGTASGALAHGD